MYSAAVENISIAQAAMAVTTVIPNALQWFHCAACVIPSKLSEIILIVRSIF
jgi:hypothetical protein